MSAPAKNWPETSLEDVVFEPAVAGEFDAAVTAATNVDAARLEGFTAIFLLKTCFAAKACLAGKPVPAATVEFFLPQREPVPEAKEPEETAVPFIPGPDPPPVIFVVFALIAAADE